ncbi:amino acid/amide ABC transporter membrane protein 1 (HAAT family) [Variovorax sp. 54]|uniref:branched-chain amino acid ABC transporter permease n=1 Tax=Variovorax sp. 54 TaxID=2035212 RepID=UPI000C174718|nr:branched-chain amino acid ABC transporter permease [Variovorax sp. 54]PIF73708.1 amino acid/amide ABC transporter membrane protein 1 (HAAT family) [Variovorax sp. 54]
MVDEFAIVVIRGIGLGAIFALIAMSMNIVYGATHILNFAQGNMFVLGGFVAVAATPAGQSMVLWLALIPAAALVLALVVAVQGWITLVPLRHSVEQNSWLITTMAVSIMISATLLLVQGPWAATARSPMPPLVLFGVRTPGPYIAVMALAVFWFIALRLFLTRTLVGLAVSALSQDLEAARAAGLKVRQLQLLAFGISGLVVGSAGFVAAPLMSISADTGIRYVLNGFVASVIGGMGSNLGAMVGGALVGVVSMLAIYLVGGEYQGLVSLLLLVGMLLIRPEGLFGRASARRV